MVKNLPSSARDAREVGSISGSGRSSGEGNGNLLQYSCLKNSMDRDMSNIYQLKKNKKYFDSFNF